jgi:hypothetical protein
MTDLLVRDVPEHVVAALDAQAAKLGLSRSQYLRRKLAQEAPAAADPVTADDLRSFSDAFADLSDPDVMRGAWE